MKIDIIGVPLCLGSGKRGAELGPDKMRERGIADVLTREGVQAYDLGNMFVPQVAPSEMYAGGGTMKYFREIRAVTRNLAETVSAALAGGGFPLVVGGDHSLSLGSISGTSAHFGGDLAVVWIDAHGDINTEESSPSGNMHGMPLAALMGHGNRELTGLYRPLRKVDPRNVFIVGVRSLDDGEVELIESERINVYTMQVVRERGVAAVAADIVGKIGEACIANVHVSLDIDVVDPAYAPGTGTTVAEGMLPDELRELLGGLIEAGGVRSMDLVELNPALDRDDMTTELCIDVVDFTAAKLRTDREG